MVAHAVRSFCRQFDRPRFWIFVGWVLLVIFGWLLWTENHDRIQQNKERLNDIRSLTLALSRETNERITDQNKHLLAVNSQVNRLVCSLTLTSWAQRGEMILGLIDAARDEVEAKGKDRPLTPAEKKFLDVFAYYHGEMKSELTSGETSCPSQP